MAWSALGIVIDMAKTIGEPFHSFRFQWFGDYAERWYPLQTFNCSSTLCIFIKWNGSGMVATSVTVTTIIRYQPASQASLYQQPCSQWSWQVGHHTINAIESRGASISWSQWSWQGGVSSLNGGKAMVGVAVQVISIGTTALHRWSSWLWWQSL